MKGDFTRSTFKLEKKYSSVRMQQGRVQLDSDWNEQMDINAYRIEKEARDLIGPCGVPQDGGGFEIVISDKKRLTISPGRIYIDGILCENLKDEAVDITKQEDFPGYQMSDKEGIYLAYLDVWQRHITVIEDPQIREVALGGPDTATRTKTVWQVKLEELKEYKEPPEYNGPIDCQAVNKEWEKIIKKREGKLAALTKKGTLTESSCVVSPDAGYRRLENQLYRVEIHQVDDKGKATFKWSHDNGSVVFAIEEFVTPDKNNTTKILKLKQLGRDKTLSLKAGDWVEVLDDVTELSENPAGTLAKITEEPNAAERVITLSKTVTKSDLNNHPKVRRWDQQSDAISVVPPSGSDSIELEDGIHVRFSGSGFKTGDYWLIPARTATGTIEWPLDEKNNPLFKTPEGIIHYYCHLAILKQDNNKEWTRIYDCRKLFPVATELTSLTYVSGDGQEAMPGEELPEPLQVSVSNGKWPVKDAFVKFEIKSGGGKLSAKNPVSSNPLIVKTNPEGVAECTWELGVLDLNNSNNPPDQQVEARLLDVCKNIINTPIRFNANLSVASQVAYTVPDCPRDTINEFSTVKKLLKENFPSWPPVNKFGNVSVKGILDTFLCDFNAAHLPLDSDLCRILSNEGVKTVQDALNALCREIGSGRCCIFVANRDELLEALDKLEDGSTICLLAGDFEINEIWMKGRNNIVIRGCSLISKIIGNIHLEYCQNIVIKNLDVSGSLNIIGEEDKKTLSQNIVLKNLNITGNVYVESTTNFSLKNSLITKIESPCLTVISCSEVIIESNFFTIKGKGERGLVFDGSNDLKIHKNRINVDFSDNETDKASSINAVNSRDIEITNNLIQISGYKDFSEITVVGIGVVDDKESEVKGNVSVVGNTVNSINAPSLNIQYEGLVRVHGNSFTSLFNTLGSNKENGIAINIEFPQNQIIFTDNSCYSYCNDIGKGKYFHLIFIGSSLYSVFSNNICNFEANNSGDIQTELVHVYVNCFYANIIGNMCSESIKGIQSQENGKIFSLRAPTEIPIVIGNIGNNKIDPIKTELNLENI